MFVRGFLFLGGLPICIYLILKQDKFRETFKQLLEVFLPTYQIRTYAEIPNDISKETELFIIEPLFSHDERNIEKIGELAKKGYPVCTISDDINDQQLVDIMSLKVRGVLFKSMDTTDLIKGLEEVIYGGTYLPSKAASILLKAFQDF